MRLLFLLGFFTSALFLSSCAKPPLSIDARTQMSPAPKLAFINAPVVDVLGSGPTKTSHTYSESRYDHLPCGYMTAHHQDPPRVHQLLLNQIVKIRAEKPFEALVEVPGVKIGSGSKTVCVSGWVLKRHLSPIKLLDKKRHKEAAFADPFGLIGRKKTERIALIHPYHIRESKQTLSAGTLFPLVKEYKETYLTHIWDEREQQFQSLIIPKSVAIPQIKASREEAMLRFVSLLRFWANQKPGFIPYVLGGGSWTHNYKEKRFAKRGSGKSIEYHRVGSIDNQHSGFDCTTLIYNAAQIANIPYTCRNTTAISQMLKEIKPGERIEVGDLLLYPGHVAMISSTKPLRLIQSRGYGPGYGRVVEGPSHEHLSNIKTLTDLQSALKKKKPLTILNIRKKPYRTLKNWSIYRFRSCWDTEKK